MDRIDRILLAEEELTPSPGFGPKVMEAVRQEGEELGPIPFPWLSFSLGFVALPLLLAAGLWLLLPMLPVTLQVDLGELLGVRRWLDTRLLWSLAVALGSGLLVLWSYDLAERT